MAVQRARATSPGRRLSRTLERFSGIDACGEAPLRRPAVSSAGREGPEEAPTFFYARHGLEVVAVVDDHPRGHQSLLLRERLGPAG